MSVVYFPCVRTQERLAESGQEQETLVQVVSELEGQLGEVRVQLDQEKHNCRYMYMVCT